jgi:hypothetical protein
MSGNEAAKPLREQDSAIRHEYNLKYRANLKIGGDGEFSDDPPPDDGDSNVNGE